MAGKIKEIIDRIIQERSKGNPAIAEMTKAKFILKGVNPNKFSKCSEDDPVIIEKLITIARQLNAREIEGSRSNMKSVFSAKSSEEEAVLDIKKQLEGIGVKLLIYFASSNFDQDRLSNSMQKAFKDCIVFGCSTAGEIVNRHFLKNSVVAMAFNSKIFSDAKVEVIEQMSENLSVEAAFKSFEQYYQESSYKMEASRYVGLVLIDGISMKEENVMDQIGNRTNVYFIGGSAGDDLKYSKTFVYANGKAYTDSAVLVLLKMNVDAEFGIIKTQSFKALDHVLIANKVNEATREVIEFNNRPAISAYASAVHASSVEEAQNYFMSNPVGLVIGENNILVRTPLLRNGTSIQFACKILEGMEVKLLESTNIIEDTKNALEKKMNEFGKIEGIINFHCIMRTLELEKKNLVKEYGELFSGVPTIGFSTYGEEYIGHINQTSTILVFKTGSKPSNYHEVFTPIETHKNLTHMKRDNERLINENSYLQKEIFGLNQQLEETTAALKQFNIILEEEINERTKREQEITYLSYHDKLTGLYNRRFFEEEIKRLDNNRNLPISIINGDVNGLKLLNDTFGHDKGDELLQKAAAAIQSACRADDIVARWGGDEFVVLLPKTDMDEVGKIVTRIKNQSSNEHVNGISVSIAFGWATKIRPNENILKVLKSAEDYMYKYKILENEGI
ncbi:sensor domain-containing diguanylate cyclase [Desulfosporosinus nitroreducens]|uniref:Diguanylate cyclase n=1 Tax=Desulfosporosinus nitroreducens TaxID=2018668 RepID=A0ABT8R022_9FIRM|nr:FIST N-terminal domain-containing protein [Desulfosporosinus nitroreducens]MCO1604279.1 diguanylate cyclase [Desulfosporosinus nitroreducens]MDO0825618.1 diguanylate cyclase [Desulfosporosinus nitroreducens]